MSPNGRTRGKKVIVPSNIYTVILTLAFAVVLASATYIAYTCYSQYDTIFKIP